MCELHYDIPIVTLNWSQMVGNCKLQDTGVVTIISLLLSAPSDMHMYYTFKPVTNIMMSCHVSKHPDVHLKKPCANYKITVVL